MLIVHVLLFLVEVLYLLRLFQIGSYNSKTEKCQLIETMPMTCTFLAGQKKAADKKLVSLSFVEGSLPVSFLQFLKFKKIVKLKKLYIKNCIVIKQSIKNRYKINSLLWLLLSFLAPPQSFRLWHWL